MQPQDQKPGGVVPQVHAANDIPREEQSHHPADDEEAKVEIGELPTRALGAPQWRVAQSLQVLKDQVDRLAPNRSKASDGSIGDAAHASRSSDHNPWVIDGNIGVVTARDITHDPNSGCDANAIAESIKASRDARVKYIIWNKRIASSSPIGGQPAWAWRPYNGANPHNKHIHISVLPEKSAYDSTAAWAVEVLA